MVLWREGVEETKGEKEKEEFCEYQQYLDYKYLLLLFLVDVVVMVDNLNMI